MTNTEGGVMKFEPGKFYRTRDGRKAFVAAERFDSKWRFSGWIDGQEYWDVWLEDGRKGETESGFDLVAEWADSPKTEKKTFYRAISASLDELYAGSYWYADKESAINSVKIHGWRIIRIEERVEEVPVE